MSLDFYIHDDCIVNKILPGCFIKQGNVYIMQEDRVVFYGDKTNAERFIIRNKGVKMAIAPYIKKDIC